MVLQIPSAVASPWSWCAGLSRSCCLATVGTAVSCTQHSGPLFARAPHFSQACLKLVAERETRYRVQWYYKLFEQTMRGLNRYCDHKQ
jgi:hypothetical protein